jgi:RNA polymerase sigma-70 factor (ECF subfamily)
MSEQRRLTTCESEIARLFEVHADLLLGYCLRRTGSRTDAEDAVQTTFLYALRALRRGVLPECESAWLTAIARNVCHWQRRTLERRGPCASEVDPDWSAEPPSPRDEGLCDLLRSALASLPVNQQRALVLREWHGLSSSEVAAELGMSTSATYALLTRARRSMAQALTTVPRRAALGLATLVYELRSHVKALAGGSAASKAVATTTAVVAVTVGGATVEGAALADRGTSRSGPGVVEPSSAHAQPTPSSSRPARTPSAKATAVGRAPTDSAAVARDHLAQTAVPRDHLAQTSPQIATGVARHAQDRVVRPTPSAHASVTALVPEPEQPLALLREPAAVPGLLPEPPSLPLPTPPNDLLAPASELPEAPTLPVDETAPAVDPPPVPPLPDPGLP